MFFEFRSPSWYNSKGGSNENSFRIAVLDEIDNHLRFTTGHWNREHRSAWPIEYEIIGSGLVLPRLELRDHSSLSLHSSLPRFHSVIVPFFSFGANFPCPSGIPISARSRPVAPQ